MATVFGGGVMVFQLFVFLILISSGVYFSIVRNRNFEKGVLFSGFAIVFILFLAGMLKHLLLGVYIILALVAGLYLYVVVVLFKAENWKEKVNHLFTPAFFIYCGLFAVTTVFNCGRVPYTSDEFSHWADVVKVMLIWDDFGTNANADMQFATYPPGISLFQYFVLKLYNVFHQTSQMNEWRLYFSYQIFTYSLFFPFLDALKFSKPKRILGVFIVVLLAPTYFLNAFFESVYVDTFLAVLFGVGISFVFFDNPDDKYVKTMILCINALLVLTKPIGVFFSVLLSLFCVIKLLTIGKRAKEIRRDILSILLLIASIGVPYVLWNINVRNSNCYYIHNGIIDWKEYFEIILKRENNIGVAVWNEFVMANAQNKIRIKNLGISVSSILVLLIVISVFTFLWLQYNKEGVKKFLIDYRWGILCFLVLHITYVIGLSITYIYKMPEFGTEIPAFERYLSTIFLTMLIPSFVLLLYLIQNAAAQSVYRLYFYCIVFLMFAPHENILKFFDRQFIYKTLGQREKYMILTDKILEYADGEELEVFLVDQTDKGTAFWRLHYLIRPCDIKNNGARYDREWSWELGPQSSDNWWAWDADADEVREELCNNFDVVAIWRIDDYFIQNYSVLFAEPDTIEINRVYTINKETGLLELYK